MAEQITLQQIVDLMRQELAAVEERMGQKLATQTAQVAEMVDQKLAAQEVRMDQKLAALKASQDARFDAIDARHEQVMETLQVIIQSVGQQMTELKDDIKREVRILAENDEGRKIASLYEESQAHKAMLNDHETRITDLEAAAAV